MDTLLLVGRFDQTTRVIIEQRWPIVRRHLIDWLDRDEQQIPLLEGVSLTPLYTRVAPELGTAD